jgi:hypothetical protein
VGQYVIGAGTTRSSGYTAASTNITVIDQGVLGSTTVAQGFLDGFVTGSINNSGKVISNTATGAGVRFQAGGNVSNQSGASIGGGKGVYITGIAGTVINTGSIGASTNAFGDFGVRLNLGGSVTNNVNGVISGAYGGVDITGNTGTGTNSGNVIGSAVC